MRRLAVFGAGGHGRVIGESAVALGWSIEFFDDSVTGVVDGHVVVGNSVDLVASAVDYDGVIPAIGNNRIRLNWAKRLRATGASLVAIIDQSCHVSPTAHVEAGSFLAPGAIVGAGSRVGFACIVNTLASVDHDCYLHDAVHLSPGVRLSGSVEVGEATWLGTGTSVRNNLVIGPDVVAGVGSAIVGNISGGLTVVGVPARPLERS